MLFKSLGMGGGGVCFDTTKKNDLYIATHPTQQQLEGSLGIAGPNYHTLNPKPQTPPKTLTLNGLNPRSSGAVRN